MDSKHRAFGFIQTELLTELLLNQWFQENQWQLLIDMCSPNITKYNQDKLINSASLSVFLDVELVFETL